MRGRCSTRGTRFARLTGRRPPSGLGSVAWARADVRSSADLDEIAPLAAGSDALLLLPGVSLGQSLAEYSDDQVAEVADVNFAGQFRAIKRIAPVMAEGSHIVIMGSMAGQRGSGDPLYGATKGAMHALAKSLAKSLVPRTRVNVIAPGIVTETAMADATPQATLEAHLAATPTGHFISAADLARITLDILQPHWRQMNGACMGGIAILLLPLRLPHADDAGVRSPTYVDDGVQAVAYVA